MSVTSAIVDGDVAEIVGRNLPWRELAGRHVLVAGAGGMLASYVVRSLLALNDRDAAGITVHALVRDEQRGRRALADVVDRADVRLIAGDVASFDYGDAPLDVVVHGATPARPAQHGTDPVATLKAHLLGTLHLLDLAVAKGARHFALMSSAEVYGAQPPGTRLIAEDSYGGLDILDPRACYAEGKRAAETAGAVYAAQHGIAFRAVRFGHVYGPGLALDDGRVQADFAADVVAGRDIVLNSAGTAVRTYTYVADAVAGLFTALLLGDEPAYNVADPRGLVSIRELAELFTQTRPEAGLSLRFADAADERSYSPAAAQGLDSARVTALGWEPLVDLPSGLRRMVTALGG